MANNVASAIYSGTVRHRRFSPKSHAFSYRVFMFYLDTLEINQLIAMSPLWSTKKFAPIQFRRRDFHIDETHLKDKTPPSIDESVRTTVHEQTGLKLTGPIRMLVNLRYWGYNMNPLSTYYCFDDEGKDLLAILAEVHNTPWGERHAYVLSADNFSKKQHVRFSKAFHVSPFNPIDMEYQWHSTTPNETLALHLENWQDGQKIMDATMTLERETLSARSMNSILIRFPWMTVKIITAIYWQALKLWWKGVPLFNHPSNTATNTTDHKTKTLTQYPEDSRL